MICCGISRFLLVGGAAFATSFVERPFPETVKNAEAIVRGRVGMSYADWGQDPGDERRIFTFIEIAIDETLKGNLPSSGSLIARELGGEKDGIGMKVHGSASFSRGEEVVVFLRTPANPDGSYPLKGLMMGKLEILKDATSGEEVLRGPALGLAKGHLGHSGEGHSAPDGSKWTLSRLRQLVREQGSAGPAGGVEKPKDSKPSGQSSAAPTQSVASAPSLQPSPRVEGGMGEVPVPSDREALGRLGVLLLGTGLFLGWGLRSFLAGR